jgi:hypothetical protein
MRHDGLSVTAMMALAAFAVERVTTGILFLLSFWQRWQTAFPDPDELTDSAKSAHAKRKAKLAYFVLAGLLVLLVVSLSPQIRILNALNINASAPLDAALTCLVLVAGSDRIGELVKGGASASAESSSKPVEIKGRIQLVESADSSTKELARSASRAGD